MARIRFYFSFPLSDTTTRNQFNHVGKFFKKIRPRRSIVKNEDNTGGVGRNARVDSGPVPRRSGRFESNLLHHAPINVEAFAEEKFHGLDEHAGFELLAARNEFLERHAGSNLK